MTSTDARDIIARFPGDFFTLSSSQVADLLAEADRFNYRAPRNANGSRARYFHAYCVRLAARS